MRRDRHGSMSIVAPVDEAAHVELAGRRGFHRSVRDAVDHHAARPADPFAAIVIERDRLLAGFDQPLVDDVEHLEERHVGADVARVVAPHRAGRVGTRLSPDEKSEVHLYDLCDSATFSNTSGSLCKTGAACRRRRTPRPTRTRSARSSRFASPSGVSYSVRKCAPHDSSRCQRVAAHQLRQLEEVRHASGVLERLIELRARARHRERHSRTPPGASG